MYKYPKLYRGTLVRRYKRFFADIIVDEPITEEIKDSVGNIIGTSVGDTITAHCPNTGSMRSLLNDGEIPINNKVLYSIAQNPDRKLRFTLELIQVGTEWIVVNTILVNKIVERALFGGELLSLFSPQDDVVLKREFSYKDSRFDFFIDSDVPTLIEVKSVTYFDDSTCYFPDAVTTRGQKHLLTLKNALSDGYRAVMLYVCMVKRDRFEAAIHIDPVYAEILTDVVSAGVEKKVVLCLYDEAIGCVTIKEK